MQNRAIPRCKQIHKVIAPKPPRTNIHKMFRHLTADGLAADLRGHTLVLPSLGVGNVAQLAADLLISTLRLRKAAVVWHPAIVPIVGPRAFAHDAPAETTGACELYTSEPTHHRQLSVLQMRTPLAPAAMDAFVGELLDYFRSAGVARLIVLTSSYAYEKHLVGGAAFAFVPTERWAEEAQRLFGERLGAQRFEGDVIFGGGFARRVLEAAGERELEAVVLFKYVSEGDNRPDAADMVGMLGDGRKGAAEGGDVTEERCCWPGACLPRDDKGAVRLVVPLSWKLLFGNEAPEEMY